MRKIKHNKLRNTGLLYEFLLRQITSDVLSDNVASSTVNIIKKRFSETTELGKELQLYNLLMNKNFKSDRKANYFITEVLNIRQSINNSKLKREKYNLIKEIRDSFDVPKLFSSKISNYKIYASIYKLFEYNLSPDEKTESYFNIMEHVTTDRKNIKLSDSISSKLPEDEDLRILTYKTLLEKFNQKYTKLNLSQKSLLKEYINNVSNTNSLKDYILKELEEIKRELKKYQKNVQDDVVKIKLKEATNSVEEFCKIDNSNVVKDETVVQFMRYYELIKELKKSGNKKQKVI